MIAIIDYGMGNLRSVQKAFEKISVIANIVPFPRDLERARGIVLPGVGAFGQAMEHLRMIGWDTALHKAVERGVPLIGICLGMQLLFESSEESRDIAAFAQNTTTASEEATMAREGQHTGLGILRGAVKRFKGNLKVPQMGWNQLHIVEAKRASPLLRNVADGSYAFFVHSYYCAPSDEAVVLATTDYGIEFASIVGHNNVFGAQFHPEKSQSVGLTMLANFAELVKRNQ